MRGKFLIELFLQLRLLNPGEASGADKDPDDPWDLAHPRCRGKEEEIACPSQVMRAMSEVNNRVTSCSVNLEHQIVHATYGASSIIFVSNRRSSNMF